MIVPTASSCQIPGTVGRYAPGLGRLGLARPLIALEFQ